MIKFNKPINLNGIQLLDQLKDAKINVIGRPVDDGNNGLWLSIDEADRDQAAAIVAAHIGTISAPEISADKAAVLAKLGLTADEVAALLG